jgi:hypothetical protein
VPSRAAASLGLSALVAGLVLVAVIALFAAVGSSSLTIDNAAAVAAVVGGVAHFAAGLGGGFAGGRWQAAGRDVSPRRWPAVLGPVALLLALLLFTGLGTSSPALTAVQVLLVALGAWIGATLGVGRRT